MKKILFKSLISIFVAFGICSSLFYSDLKASDSNVNKSRPNILIIVADDMGYSDIGVLGSEINTPNIDNLAEKGTLFTRFYTAPTCSPTRSMLLTGVDNHLAGLGNMAETIDPAQKGKSGYEGFLNNDVASIAEIFSAAKYQTYMTGKWHLGRDYNQSPHARGFQKTFALLDGGASHFSDRIGQDVYRREAFYRQNGKLVEKLPEDFYSSNYFTDTMIKFIKEGKKDKPFLAYLAFTAPHWPLQAPKEDIDSQYGKYSDGYDVIREKRFKALKKLGLINKNATLPKGTAPSWDSLTKQKRVRNERVMEVYAAMVENMDRNIGKLLSELKSSSKLDNTIIVFMSDNGADGLEFDAIGKAFADWTNSFDNNIDNIGHKNSFVSYGRGWAHVGEAPHAGFKGLMTEGGIRSPLIISTPINNNKHVNRYSYPITVRDILPTLMDYANIPDHKGIFSNKKVHPISGTSLKKAINENKAIHSGKAIASELWNRRSLMFDNWKIVQDSSAKGDGKWKLYDIEKDLSESKDLSAQKPELLKKLIAEYNDYAKNTNVIKPTAPFRLIKPNKAKPEK